MSWTVPQNNGFLDANFLAHQHAADEHSHTLHHVAKAANLNRHSVQLKIHHDVFLSATHYSVSLYNVKGYSLTIATAAHWPSLARTNKAAQRGFEPPPSYSYLNRWLLSFP